MSRICALGGYPPIVSLLASLVLIGSGAIRGSDYFFGDDPETARRLSTLEAAAPLWVWGIALLLFSIAGFIAIILDASRALMLAHFGHLTIYAALATAIVTDVVERQNPNPQHIIISTAAGLCTAGVVALILALRGTADHWRIICTAIFLTIAIGGGSIALDGIRNATALAALALLHGVVAFGIAGKLRQHKIVRGEATV